MRYFPERYDEIKSLNPVEKILSNINSNSDKSYSLTMKRTNKFLRGYTDKNFFKVISAEVPLGAFCVFEGQLVQKEYETIIKLNSKFHKTFRIMLFVWGILPVFAIIVNCFQTGVIALALLLPLAMFYTIIYFVIKFYFKRSYENGIKDLNRIINE